MDEPRLLGGRYELGELLGRGGMAEVHRGRDLRLGRDVAIKMLRADLARDPSFQTRFRREAQSAASLNHPAIVAVYDTGEDDAERRCRRAVHRHGVRRGHARCATLLKPRAALLPRARAGDHRRRAAPRCDYSHRAGIVHRDIKPANVMLTPTGAVKVMDFGIARAVADLRRDDDADRRDASAPRSTSRPSRPGARSVDARSRPVLDRLPALRAAHRHGRRSPATRRSPSPTSTCARTPDPPSQLDPDVAPPLDAIVMKALAKNPDNRYQSAAEMRADIKRALAGRPVLATPVLFDAPTRVYAPSAAETAMAVRPARRTHPILRGLVYLLLFGAVGAVVFFGVYELHKSFGDGTTTAAPTVPNLSGLTKEAAITKLLQDHFVPDAQTGNSKKPVGTVYAQSPVALAEAPAGSTVTFKTSLGAALVPVPDVKGLSLAEAKAKLNDNHFLVGTITLKNGPTQKNQVITSSPGTGVKVQEGSAIKLLVGSGLVVVPGVIGKTYEDALQIMTNAGLAVVKNNVTGPQPLNTVRYQTPYKDAKVPVGTQVVLNVVFAPRQVVTNPPTTTPPPPTSAAPTTPTPGTTTTKPPATTTKPPATTTKAPATKTKKP